MDNWQLQSQIQKTLAATGGKAPQSPIITAPITITSTNVKTGAVTKEVIPAGTKVKEIEKQAIQRLASQKAGIDVPQQAGIEGVEGTEGMPGGAKITIPITASEIAQTASDKAKAQSKGVWCTTEVQVFKIKTRDGSTILVEVVGSMADANMGRRNARSKAEAAGYEVMSVTKVASKDFLDAHPELFQPKTLDVKREERDGAIKLDSGEWVPKKSYDKLPQESQSQLNKLGIDGYNQWVVDEAGKQIKTSGTQYLIDAFGSGGIDGYNNAVAEYNKIISDAKWLALYTTYKQHANEESFKDNWAWFQDTYADELNDPQYMSYIESSEFRNKYASIIQPSAISNEDYALIKPYITPDGFDSEAAYQAGENNPTIAGNIIRVTNKFTLATLDDETKVKINSGEWTLLPYGQVIETKTLEKMPPTYRDIVRNSGLVGYEAYQEKVIEWNKEEGWVKNTIDAIGAQSVGLGQDIKNFALLELSASMGEVKEGDPKPIIGPLSPGGVGYIGFITPTIAIYTAEEAAALNTARAKSQKYYKDLYDEAEMAAQEWMASRPYLHPVYPAGFVDSVKNDPSALKDPLLWTETIASTLPYTVATGLIVGGAAAGGAGLAITAPLAFGITMSVEGHDIYKDAIAHGADHDQALKLANTYGAISASIETLGDTIFVGALGVGAGAFSQALGKNLGTNIIRGAAKKYGWKTLTVGMIKDFVNQGGQEFFQEVVHNAAVKTVDQNQALLENTANAFVSGVIGTAPFVLFPAGGQAIRRLETRAQDVRAGKANVLTPVDITPQMQLKILNKVFSPVSGFTVTTTEAEAAHIKKFPTEVFTEGGPVGFAQKMWDEKGKNIYRAGKGITVGLIDKKSVITGQAKVDEVALAYAKMSNKVNEYAATQLKLKQAEKAIADFGMAKSGDIVITNKTTGKYQGLKAYLREHPDLAKLYDEEGLDPVMAKLKKDKSLSISTVGELGILEEYEKRADELEAQLKELKDPMIEAVQNFSDVFLKNSVGLEAEQKVEVREMAKTIAMDIDSVTTQLFGERTAKEIAKDVRELEGQINVIEEEMAKGMTREQLEGYARLINILRSQIGGLVNELRMRYLAEGEKIKPETKKLAMEVMSLQARLVKAVENLQNFSGSVLDYDVYRKGELAHGAEVVKLERDTFEAIQKTTEATWGKESYASVLEQLNRTLGDIISSMESLESQKRATKAAFKIYDAIKKQDIKALKEGVRLLQLEAGKIKDKPLQLQAGQQIKLIEGLTLERFWARFQQAKAKSTKEEEVVWHKGTEFASGQKDMIRRDAERIVALRLERLMDKLPGYMKRWSPDAIMDYLRKTYDAQYFKDVHFGEFEDLDDYLDVDKEEHTIQKEVARQEDLQAKRLDLQLHETERDLARKLRDKATNPLRKQALDKNERELSRQVEQKRVIIAMAEKTKLVTPAVETRKLEGPVAKEEALVPVAKEEAEDRLARAKTEERAAKRVRIAKKAIVGEEEAARKKERKEKPSGFPGIVPKTKEVRVREYGMERVDELTRQLADYLRTMTPDQALKQFTDTEDQAIAQAGIQTYIKSKTRGATKQQTKTAIQTAVKAAVQEQTKTALKTETETATEQETETATEIVTEIVTKTATKPKTLIPPRPFRTEPVQGKQKKIREGPALAVWKQGAYWVSIFPPFRTTGKKEDVVYSREKPPWGSVIARGRHAPKRTLRSMGKVPELITVPMGVVTARIRKGRHLSFSRSNGRRRGRVIQG